MRHLQTFQRLGNVKVVAVPTRAERLTELRDAGYQVCRNLQEARAEGASLLVIATDTKRHLSDLKDAWQSGFHVMVEKPLCPSLIDLSDYFEGEAFSKRRVIIGNVLRFMESLNQFRAWLPRLGSIHSVRIECLSYLPDWRPDRPYQSSYSARADEGGVLRDLVHEIDYAGWLFGWPTSLKAHLRNLGRLGIASEEAADLYWQTCSRTSVSIGLDYLTRPARRTMRASGEFGSLEWNAIEKKVRFEPASGMPEEQISTQTRDEMFLAQSRAVLESCRGIDDERLAFFTEGANAVSICDAARLSSASRREEPIVYL